MDGRVRERLGRLDRPAQDYVVALEQEVAGEPMPPEPAATPADMPPIIAERRLLDQRVRERMREIGARESDYPRILDQVLQEEA
jgi:hypothetical protein